MRHDNLSDTTVNISNIPSVDEFTARIESTGGKIIATKKAIPGTGYLVKCKETEGTTFVIMDIDESAKFDVLL